MGLFQDSLKKWFYTNNTNAASSDARVPLLNANGTPKGSDTMTNLASVLGAFRYIRQIQTTDVLDNITETGFYNCGAGTSSIIDHPGKSEGYISGFVLEVILASDNSPSSGYTLQRITYVNYGAVYERIRSTSSWGVWKKILLE